MKTELAIVILGILFLILLFLIIRYGTWVTRGERGEILVSKKLHSLGIHYIVLDDLLIRGVHGDTQIDHVVVSPFGVFVIETKCWKGWITGGENAGQWCQTLYREKYDKPNPIFQNKVHEEAVKRALKEYGDIFTVPIVVIVDCDRLKVKTNHIVILYQNLKDEIRSFTRIIYSDDQCEKMALTLQGLSSDDKERREQHIQKVKSFQASTQAKIENGICPRCGGQLVLREGRYGRFYGCSNYPICKFISNI